MDYQQETMAKLKAEQDLQPRAGYGAAANLDDCVKAQTPGMLIGGISAKQQNSRERLMDVVRNHKETYLRKLVTLQRAEDKLNNMRLSEAEAVQEFLDLLAQSGV